MMNNELSPGVDEEQLSAVVIRLREHTSRSLTSMLHRSSPSVSVSERDRSRKKAERELLAA